MLDSSCLPNSTLLQQLRALSPLCLAERGERVENPGQNLWTQAQEQGCLPTKPYQVFNGTDTAPTTCPSSPVLYVK